MATKWKWKKEGLRLVSTKTDPERDCKLEAFLTADYNGYPVVIFISTGYPIMVVAFGSSNNSAWSKYTIDYLVPDKFFSDQAQSMVAFQEMIEGVDEDIEQTYFNGLDGPEGRAPFEACFHMGRTNTERLVKEALMIFRRNFDNDLYTDEFD